MLTKSQCRGGLSPIGKLSASERLPHPEADGVARAGKDGKKGGVIAGQGVPTKTKRKRKKRKKKKNSAVDSSGQGVVRKLPLGGDSQRERVELGVGE